MSDADKAVFLSYASQDAEAAKRICEALRAAGVEVWFDQSELRGGDAWDAKIRKQIKECALFVPIISAATQARTEGYFRLEWRLADQRTHLMARGRPFLLPVVIDDTRDADANVPDSFTEVQWTRSKDGETSAAWAEHVKRLLGGSDPAAGRPRPLAREPGAAAPAKRGRAKLWWALPIFGVTMALVLVLKESKPSLGTTPVSAAPQSEAGKLVAQARQIYEGGDEINRENLAFAEELVKRALALDPADPAAWEIASKLSCALVWYSLDASESRRELLMQQANRARALAPQAVSAQLAAIDARLALNFGRVAVPPDFEQEVRELVTREPGNWSAQRAWSTLLRFLGDRPDESLAAIRRAVELSNGYPGAVADLINTLVRQRKFAEADAVITKYLPTRPTGRLLCWDVILRLRWRGGPAAAQQSLARFPTWLLQEDRGLFLAWQTWFWSRDAGKALRAAQAAQRDYVRDFSFYGPRAVLTAQAHELAGSTEAARADWQTALARADRELATDAQAEDALYWKAWALARLGRTAEARVITAQLRQRNRDGLSAFFKGTSLAALLATTGEVDEAIAEIVTRLNTLDDSIGVTRPGLALDPAFDPLRADPRFVAVLEQAPAPAETVNGKTNAAAGLDDKSVAVLAFANLSDEKANEYFSDGISEELLNVLAKVPGLKVSARTSAFFFKGKDVPIPEIAQKLGVAYVVEGSVRKAGDKVRITAQLIKAADGFHVWSDTFTRDLKDIFAVQDEIAGLIAQNLQLKLGDTPRTAKPVNPAAFNLFLEARQYVATVSVANLTKAEALYLKALEIDPDFTRAAAGLAVLRATRALNRCVPSRYMEPELADIERATRDILRRDSNVGEAHAALGLVRAGRGQNPEAEAAFAEAGRLGFNREQASHIRAFSLFRSGRPDLAIAAMEEARRVNPLAWTPIDVGGLGYLFTRRYAQAAEAFRAAARTNGAPVTSSNLALALIGLGRNEEAIAAARQAIAVPNRADWQPGFLAWSDGLAAWALAQAGARTEAEAVVGRLLAGPVESRYAANYALIVLGRLDEAAATLEDQGGNHGYLFFFLNERPALLDDPRIGRLLAKLRAEEDFATFRRVVTEQAVQK